MGTKIWVDKIIKLVKHGVSFVVHDSAPAFSLVAHSLGVLSSKL